MQIEQLAEHQESLGWRAKLQLAFDFDGERTRLIRKGGIGPLYVQKPFYPEGDLCHAYLLHPPGVVAGGDQLSLEVEVCSGARVLITTPAATKFLRTKASLAQQEQIIRIADDAHVEWLPQESIVFNDALASSKTLIQIQQNATYIGCELFSLARPTNKEAFTSGSYTSTTKLERYCHQHQRYRPLYYDHQHYSGGSKELQAQWGLGGHPVMGTLIATPCDEDLLARVRQAVICSEPIVQSTLGATTLVRATLVRDVLVIRCLGYATSAVQTALRQCWAIVRPLLTQREAHFPAIWRT